MDWLLNVGCGFWLSPVLIRMLLRDKKLSWYIAAILLSVADTVWIFVLSLLGFNVYIPIVFVSPLISLLMFSFVFWAGMLAMVNTCSLRCQMLIVGFMWLVVFIRYIATYLADAERIYILGVPGVAITLSTSVLTFIVGYIFLRKLKVMF